MASQITHIVLADKVLPKFFPGLSRAEFFVGTCFPDIRYLRTISREQTHFKGLTLQDVQAETNSFTAGLKFHSLIDETREAYVRSQGVYDAFPFSLASMAAIKTFEDEVLVSKVSDWHAVVQMFAHNLPEELEFPLPEESVTRWHRIVRDYFIAGPKPESIDRVLRELLQEPGAAEGITAELSEIRKDEKIRHIANLLYDNIESLLEQKTP
jgi:hypothetical protein